MYTVYIIIIYIRISIRHIFLWQVLFDREIYTEFREDDTGMTLRCDAWEPAGGSTYRISASMLTVSGRLLTIDLKQVVSTKRRARVGLKKMPQNACAWPEIARSSAFLHVFAWFSRRLEAFRQEELCPEHGAECAEGGGYRSALPRPERRLLLRVST